MACSDAPKRPLGATCGEDRECANGSCIAGLCLDPDGDEDGDGLVNRLEEALGTNPLAADSDGDGLGDALEVGVDLANPIDSDGDGVIDALESRSADRDGDCIVDQLDPDDRTPETDPSALARHLCLATGVCAPLGAVSATCADGVAICDYSRTPDFEADERSCDGVDNDCDGQTDEHHAPGGEVVFDGGPYPSDRGKVLGQGCGTGACTGGVVVCAGDGAGLTCSTATRAGPRACGADMDCDGVPDESQVDNPLLEPLSGCRDFYADADGDGYGAGAPRCLCSPFGAYRVDRRGDCAEADPARYPTAPAVCGVDADCDGRREDVGEACDDGNDEVSDGCHACRAVARRLASDGGAPSAVIAIGRNDGGFAVAWDEGWSDAGRRLGHAVAFFAIDGREVGRISDDEADIANAGPPQLAAMSSVGGVAVGRWRRDTTGDAWRYEVQRYDGAGTPNGAPIVARRAVTPPNDTFLLATGEGRLAIVAHEPTPRQTFRLALTRIGASGQVLAGEGSLELGQATGNVDAIGLESGVVVATWGELDLATFEQTMFTTRFDADSSAPIAEPRAFSPPDTVIRRVRLARRSAAWAVFFLGERRRDDAFVHPVGYQAMDGDDAVGGIVYLQDDDRQGCPYQLAAGFDAAGFAWAVVSDGECQSPLRGWYAGATTRAITPLEEALHPGAIAYDLGGGAAGPGLVLAFAVGGQAAIPGLYVMRYGASATPVYLP